MTTFRQGDVLLIRSDIPKNAIPKPTLGKLILAEGEATGHCHAINSPHAKAWECNGITYLSIEEPVDLVHQEHGTIRLGPGSYMQIIQVEDGEDNETQRVTD